MNTTENITDDVAWLSDIIQWSERGWMTVYDLEGWPETEVGFVSDLSDTWSVSNCPIVFRPSSLENYLAQQKVLEDAEKRRLELDRLSLLPYYTD